MSISFTQYKAMAPRGGQGDNSAPRGPRIPFFSLTNDGDRAVVRFLVDSEDDIEVVHTHQYNSNGRLRRVECLREGNEPTDNCPFCAANKPIQDRVYIKLVEYVADEQGRIQPVAKIWERPMKYAARLARDLTEYGSLSNILFVVTREGAAGSTSTDYPWRPASAEKYPAMQYPRPSENLFEGYGVVGGPVASRDFQGMLNLLNNTGNAAPTTNNYTGPANAAKPAARTYSSNYSAPAAPSYTTPATAAPSTGYTAPASAAPSNPAVAPTGRPSGEPPVARPRRFY